MKSDKLQDPIYIPHSGPSLMSMPILNKGTAFTEQERQDFNLTGLIPHRFETIEEQAERAYLQYRSFKEPINKHIYLRTIQDTNETLFYYLLEQHLAEMMPIIYTPTVGEACERFSQIYRRARGLFIAYPERHHIDEILHNATKRNVKVIVVTDGSRILGLGDQGAGGMGIPIGKLSLYTACAGISPAYTLPIMLDVGTDNQTLLNNPMYMGWKHPRVNNDEYDEFIALFVAAMGKRWPGVLLQFEDFEQRKALPLLKRYQNTVCCFNDDIQGTASVAVGTLMAACHTKGETLAQQTIVFAGAGSAGCGIAEQIVAQMGTEGLPEAEARARIFMVDRQGLLTNDMAGLYDFQLQLSQRRQDWAMDLQPATLQHVMDHAKATILIGVSGQAGLFTEQLIKTMHKHCPKPIIFPLSNPSKQVEALPQDLIEWTEGQALIATGSPFMPVLYRGREYPISQCNNSYIFPGIGLAVVAAGVKRITNEMMMVASEVLAAQSLAAKNNDGTLLPPLESITALSKEIAFKVAVLAQQRGLAIKTSEAELRANIAEHFWLPRYRAYRHRSF